MWHCSCTLDLQSSIDGSSRLRVIEYANLARTNHVTAQAQLHRKTVTESDGRVPAATSKLYGLRIEMSSVFFLRLDRRSPSCVSLCSGASPGEVPNKASLPPRRRSALEDALSFHFNLPTLDGARARGGGSGCPVFAPLSGALVTPKLQDKRSHSARPH